MQVGRGKIYCGKSRKKGDNWAKTMSRKKKSEREGGKEGERRIPVANLTSGTSSCICACQRKQIGEKVKHQTKQRSETCKPLNIN